MLERRWQSGGGRMGGHRHFVASRLGRKLGRKATTRLPPPLYYTYESTNLTLSNKEWLIIRWIDIYMVQPYTFVGGG